MNTPSTTPAAPVLDPRWSALLRESRLDIGAMCATIRSAQESSIGQTLDTRA